MKTYDVILTQYNREEFDEAKWRSKWDTICNELYLKTISDYPFLIGDRRLLDPSWQMENDEIYLVTPEISEYP